MSCTKDSLSREQWFAIPLKEDFLYIVKNKYFKYDSVEIEESYNYSSLEKMMEAKTESAIKLIEDEKEKIVTYVKYESNEYQLYKSTASLENARLEEETICKLIYNLNKERYETKVIEFWETLTNTLTEQGWKDLWQKASYTLVFEINWLIYLSKVENLKSKNQENLKIKNQENLLEKPLEIPTNITTKNDQIRTSKVDQIRTIENDQKSSYLPSFLQWF